MITAFFINLGTTIATWFFSLFGTWSEPDWMTKLPDTWNTLIGDASGMSVWIPWVVILAVMGVNGVAWVAMFVLKIVMKGVAFLPFIGGSG